MAQTRLARKRGRYNRTGTRADSGAVFDGDVLEAILKHLSFYEALDLLKASKAMYYGDIGAKWVFDHAPRWALGTPIWERAERIVLKKNLLGPPSTHEGSANANSSDLVYRTPSDFWNITEV